MTPHERMTYKSTNEQAGHSLFTELAPGCCYCPRVSEGPTLPIEVVCASHVTLPAVNRYAEILVDASKKHGPGAEIECATATFESVTEAYRFLSLDQQRRVGVHADAVALLDPVLPTYLKDHAGKHTTYVRYGTLPGNSVDTIRQEGREHAEFLLDHTAYTWRDEYLGWRALIDPLNRQALDIEQTAEFPVAVPDASIWSVWDDAVNALRSPLPVGSQIYAAHETLRVLERILSSTPSR